MRDIPIRYLKPSKREEELLKSYEGSRGAADMGGNIGGAIGTAAGAGISLIPPLMPFGAFITPAAGVAGNLIGRGIGWAIESGGTKDAELAAILASRRQRAADRITARNEALKRLLSGGWMDG